MILVWSKLSICIKCLGFDLYSVCSRRFSISILSWRWCCSWFARALSWRCSSPPSWNRKLGQSLITFTLFFIHWISNLQKEFWFLWMNTALIRINFEDWSFHGWLQLLIATVSSCNLFKSYMLLFIAIHWCVEAFAIYCLCMHIVRKG